MVTNYDKDETDVFDLVLARHRVAEVMGRDGFDPEETAALAALDTPINSIGNRVRIWGAVLSFMRNGVTKHTRIRGKDAGITIVVDSERTIVDFIAQPELATA